MSFVERVFSSSSGDVVASFDTPYLAPGGEYRCRYTIAWPDLTRSREIAGIDGIQALLLAMRTVHTELRDSAEYKAGTLTYLDQADLDLPPGWGEGPLHEAGPDPGR